MWLWVVAAVVMIGTVTVLIAGSGSTLADVYDDRPDSAVPTGRPLTADDLGKVRFSTALRGYRMDEVDALVDRLRADLLSRESARLADADREPAPEPAESEPPGSTRTVPVGSEPRDSSGTLPVESEPPGSARTLPVESGEPHQAPDSEDS
jgi:DivIVA domain-containing protein